MANTRLRLAAAVGLALAGCGSISNSLGLDPQAPDEFTVVSKAPLILPPNFTLRPPTPGAPRPQEILAQQQALAALLPPPADGGNGAGAGPALLGAGPGAPGADVVPRTAGEIALLSNAGAVDANPGIRALVDIENAQLLRQSQGVLEQILFWQQLPPDVIDPVAEAERLRVQGDFAVPGPVARRR